MTQCNIKVERLVFPLPTWFPKQNETQTVITAHPHQEFFPERLMLRFAGGLFEFALEEPNAKLEWINAAMWATIQHGVNIEPVAMPAGCEVRLHVRVSNLKHPSLLRRLWALLVFWRRQQILRLPHFQLVLMGRPLLQTE